jgi:CRISPR/Cas system CMR subunit Cmr6 (Cas7 group RAMP superfamily)
MKSTEILRAIYNDKAVLKKLKKSIDEYATNLKSMSQLKQDTKDIEKFIKETYGVTPTLFKKIVKSSMTQNDNTEEVVEELELIREIARSE